jgi:hypothetical protein
MSQQAFFEQCQKAEEWYEREHSKSLGERPKSIRASTQISYKPTLSLKVRRFVGMRRGGDRRTERQWSDVTAKESPF